MARVLLVSALLTVVSLPALAQETPDQMKASINKMANGGQKAEAFAKYCSPLADPSLEKRCNALKDDLAQLAEGEKSQMTLGKQLFNSGDMVKSRNVFVNVKSANLQGDKNKWLGYIDKMEKGKAAAQANPPRVAEVMSTLKSITDSGDTEIAGARGIANGWIGDAFNNVIGVAKAKAGGSSQADLDAANAALADAKRLKPTDPQIGQVQGQIQQLDAKLHAPQGGGTGNTVSGNKTPAAPAPVKNDPGQLNALKDAITSYYAHNYEDAARKLTDFINNNEARPQVTPRVEGLAYFYRGAANMAAKQSKGQSNPEGASMSDFQTAKQKGMSAPGEQYVAPRIRAAFDRA